MKNSVPKNPEDHSSSQNVFQADNIHESEGGMLTEQFFFEKVPKNCRSFPQLRKLISSTGPTK